MTSTPATTGPIAPEADDGRRSGPQTQETEPEAQETAPAAGSEVDAAGEGGGSESGDALPDQQPHHGDAHQGFPEASQQPPRPVSVLVYSDDVNTRAAVRLAIGRRPAPDLPEVRWTECATPHAVIAAADRGGLDLLILDGEAVPAGGMGLCKQLKDEIYRCPPVLVLTGRPQDAWLATWSRADFAVPHPLDPIALAEAVAMLVRRHVSTR